MTLMSLWTLVLGFPAQVARCLVPHGVFVDSRGQMPNLGFFVVVVWHWMKHPLGWIIILHVGRSSFFSCRWRCSEIYVF